MSLFAPLQIEPGNTPLQFSQSIAFKTFSLMLAIIVTLFGVVFFTMQSQNKKMAEQQNIKALVTAGQESFFVLADRFQKKLALDISLKDFPNLTRTRGFDWAWVSSDSDGTLHVLVSSAQLPCPEILKLGNKYLLNPKLTLDKPWTQTCGDKTMTTVHPAFLQNGQTRLAAVAWYSGKADNNEANKDFTQEFCAMFIIGILLAGLGSRALSSSLSTPIRYLAKAASQVANGDYTQNLAIAQEDEVGQLANAFNKMAEAVRDRENEITRLAYQDELTQLFNRIYFLKTLQERIHDCREKLFIITWDIDRFKIINEVLGFGVGDAVLSALGTRFNAELYDSVVTARLGGNSFAMIVPEGLGQDIEILAKTVMQVFERPVIIDGQPLDITATIGISHYPDHGMFAEELLRRAEIARFLAKRSHLRCLEYHSHFEVSSPARLTMLSELKTAIETPGHLQLYLQPKFSVLACKIDEAEALIRWHHPTRGLIPPGDFIPFAEQTGRIGDLTDWAIGEALKLVASTREYWPLRISVNVSAQDLEREGFAQKVIERCELARVPCAYVCLEITESGAMDDPELALSTLMILHKAGFHLAIDDFGTGYSSLSYLKQFPVNELKIDRSLVAGVQENSDGATILRSTIELGHNMGLSVTAEGVETRAELMLLKKIGIDHIQGYLIAKPMPLSEYRKFMEKFVPGDLYS